MKEQGFSMIELLAATAVTLVVAAGTVGLIQSAQSAFSAEPETADLQQRLRVTAEALFDDLVMAGAGRLDAHLAPVLPFRRGALNDDGPGRYRSDALTLYYLPANGADATLAADLTPGSRVLEIVTSGPCPQHISPCGFAIGSDVLLSDESGNFGRFTLTAVTNSPPTLTIDRPADAVATYRAGSRVAEVVDRTYLLRRDPAANTSQVMVYDGSMNPDRPLADHIVGLTFEYFGSASNTLVRQSAGDLTDGPWRPDEMSANRWDADLLRIRKVAVTIRVEAASEALRGPAGLLFANAGTSRAASVWVPDQELRFEVALRNLNHDR